MLNILMLLRNFSFPFLRYVLPLFSKKARERRDFELSNHLYVQSVKKAQVGFEISSEGELEQIYVILEHYLMKNIPVELIFCSPSVESQCVALKQKYPHLVRLYRYPILTYNPFSKLLNPRKWLTCDKLFLCRYDFFPELIKYSQRIQETHLLSASLVNFDQKNSLHQSYLKEVYKTFSKVVAVTKNDKEQIIKYFKIPQERVRNYDFRIPRIFDRHSVKKVQYQNSIKGFDTVLEHIKNIPETKKMIFGSFWKHESKIFDHYKILNEKMDIFILPHKLNDGDLKSIRQQFTLRELHFLQVDDETSLQEIEEFIQLNVEFKVWILNIKGILCELYTEFKLAYVGGGFGESIHSVLEPFLAGNVVVVGPVHHRSAEYRLIKEISPQSMAAVKEQSEVLPKLIEMKAIQAEYQKNKEYFNNLQNEVKDWLVC